MGLDPAAAAKGHSNVSRNGNGSYIMPDMNILPLGLELFQVPVATAVERTGNISFMGGAGKLLAAIQAATVNSGVSRRCASCVGS